jgi:predicted DNA-binding transcriptional regulator YafY
LLRRADLVEAFGMSTSKATQLIASEVQANQGLLVRDGYMVRSRLGAEAPPHASMRDLMAKLDAGLTEFGYTGLRADELPVNVGNWFENMPDSERAMELVVEACVKRRSVLIQYVGMRRGEQGAWRRVVPLCLDRMGDQWRLTAQDLEKDGTPVRTFVLSRILDALYDSVSIPRKFVRANPADSQRRVPVEFNLRLSDVQRQVLARELKVKDGYVTLPSRFLHEFLIRFADGGRSDDIAWPPLTQAKLAK